MYIVKIGSYLVAINMYGWEIKESPFSFSRKKKSVLYYQIGPAMFLVRL